MLDLYPCATPVEPELGRGERGYANNPLARVITIVLEPA
jgi:hypothetical protein